MLSLKKSIFSSILCDMIHDAKLLSQLQLFGSINSTVLLSEISIYERDIKEAVTIQEKPIKTLWVLL